MISESWRRVHYLGPTGSLHTGPWGPAQSAQTLSWAGLGGREWVFMTTHRLHECSETVGEGIEISPHEPHASTRVAYPGPQGRELGGGAEIGEMEDIFPESINYH